MEKKNSTEKINLSNQILHLLEGLFVGFASAIPFFHIKNFKDALSIKELPFEHVSKKEKLKHDLTKGLKDENPYKASLLKELLYLFCHRFTYLLGAIIGFALFFFIPCKTISSQYPIAIYGAFLALSLGFGFYEIVNIVKHKNEKSHYFSSLILFIITCAICFLLLKFSYSNTSMIWDNETYKKLCLAIGFFFSGFLVSFSGMSLMTLFFFSGFFLPISNLFIGTLYEHTSIMLCVISLLSTLLGSFIALVLKRHGQFTLEKSSIHLAIYVMGIIFVSMTKIKAPFLTGVSTEYAEWITIGSSVFVALLVSIALSIRKFGFLKKDKIDEELQ